MFEPEVLNHHLFDDLLVIVFLFFSDFDDFTFNIILPFRVFEVRPRLCKFICQCHDARVLFFKFGQKLADLRTHHLCGLL